MVCLRLGRGLINAGYDVEEKYLMSYHYIYVSVISWS